MYVCICKSINKSRLKQVIQEDGSTVDKVKKACGAATECGACLKKLQQFIEQSK